MRKNIIIAAVTGALALSSIAASGAPAYDGPSFVGKGEVQTALGWNNKQLQESASTLVFTYADTAEYDVPCKKEAGPQILRQSFDREVIVSSDVSYDARTARQVTGFNLGQAPQATTTEAPSCPGGWEADGDPVLIDSSGGVLKVNGVELS